MRIVQIILAVVLVALQGVKDVAIAILDVEMHVLRAVVLVVMAVAFVADVAGPVAIVVPDAVEAVGVIVEMDALKII